MTKEVPSVKLLRASALVLVTGLFVFLAVIIPTVWGAPASATNTNVVANPGFESGVSPWTCKSCALTAGAPAYSGAAAGQMNTTSRTARGQLFQSNLALQPQTQYQLTFWARSGGQDLQVDLLRPVSPITNFGLNQTFNVTTDWQQFSATFTTTGFTDPVSNARLRFRAPRGRNLQFSIDDVSLVAIGAPPTPTPSPTPQPGGSEMLVFDWNREVTTRQHGFPWDKPPLANGNWTQPINYAEGTLHLRAEIISMPVPKNMRVQFCIWQYNNTRENCTGTEQLSGTPGSVIEWSVGVQNLWKKNKVIIDWVNPRDRNGFAIKNMDGKPVSDYSGWNWNGEDPDEWYPMNARFTVVVVEKGKTFSGWDNYIAP